jgi:uncharacterized protein
MVYRIHVSSGEEVIDTVTKKLKQKGITNGVIVSIIGAVDECCISSMPKNDAKQDILIEYKEPLEMSGTGEISEGKPHIHCTFSREKNVAIAGHLHWAKVQNWFINVYVSPLK